MTTGTIDELDWDLARASVRQILEDEDRATLATRLADFGWAELHDLAPGPAVSALFEAAGDLLGPGWLLDLVVAPVLAPDATGSAAVVYPRPGATAAAVVDGGELRIDGIAFDAPDGSAHAIVATRDGQVASGPVPDRHPIRGLDPDLGMSRVHTAIAVGDGMTLEADTDAARREGAIAAGRRALAHQLVAGAEHMLALATEHARTRTQFGQPVGSFQAVAHRLADAEVAVRAARAVLTEAWREPGPRTAVLAKHWAGRAARITARHAQQVLGGLGFTWEHPLHRYVRRSLVLDGLLGSAADLARELGRTLRHDGSLPRLASL